MLHAFPAVTLALPRTGTVQYILYSGANLLAIEFSVAVRFMASEFWPVIVHHPS